MKEGPVFSRERRVLAAEIPALPQWEPEKVGSVGKRSGDGNYESGLEVRLGYLDSGGSISGGCGCGHISTYSILENKELKIPIGRKFGFFVGSHKRGRQSKCSQAEASLRASADIVY